MTKAKRDHTIRIATFNINGVHKRLANLFEWLEESQPDIACLQELKAEDKDFPIDAINAAGYEAVWQGQRSWNGVAILAKGTKPIVTRKQLPGDKKDDQARYIEAAVNGILIACLYLPNGNPQPGPKFDYKLAWYDRLIAHAAELNASGAPVVLLGDYNTCPTDEVMDVYSPKSWKKNALFQPEARDAYERLLAQGWTDSIRRLHPSEPVYTFWDYFRDHWPRNAGMRIDHLLISPNLTDRLQTAGVDSKVRGEDSASDHAPAWITLKSN